MAKRSSLKNLVNKIIWAKDKGNYQIIIIDRLDKTGYRVINGTEIKNISIFDHIILEDDSMIPLHRIKRITYKGNIIIDRDI